MTHSLVIYEMVPEETRLFLLPNAVADLYRDFLTQAHNKFVNNDEMNEGMHFLMAATSPKMEYVDEDMKDVGCIFHQYLLVNELPFEGTITHVYVTGFCL